MTKEFYSPLSYAIYTQKVTTFNPMNIAVLEAFYCGSHKRWADGLLVHLPGKVHLLKRPGKHWKWRMHGSALSFAEEIAGLPEKPDVLLVSDMVDLAGLRGLLVQHGIVIPSVLYFHENQWTYPWSPNDQDPGLDRDYHYGWINFVSACCADRILFNSAYHRDSFLNAAAQFLQRMPDDRLEGSIAQLRSRSSVCAPGLDFVELEAGRVPREDGTPIIIWNHRWEYDKNPELFFRSLIQLHQEGVGFQLVVLGESYNRCPEIFNEAKTILQSVILHWGYCASRTDYLNWLWKGHFLPVTATQDFFGYSVVEGMACGLHPLLPERLAYPEHSGNPRHFYPNDIAFVAQLRTLLQSPIPHSDCPPEIRRYAWPQLIPSYMEVLEQTCR